MLRRNKTALRTVFSPLWCGLAAGWCERFAGVVQREGWKPPLSRRFLRYAGIAEETAYAGVPRYVR